MKRENVIGRANVEDTPSWAVHSHANASSSEDAVLLSFNDFPAMRALALYREQEA